MSYWTKRSLDSSAASAMKASRRANYRIEFDEINYLVIRDVGPWDKFLSVTNAAETVVAELVDQLKGRRLFYYDSDGDLAELEIRSGVFAGFVAVPKSP